MDFATQMTPDQARVIDPILSNVAQEYRNQEYVLQDIFPVVPVAQRGGKVIKFGKEAFRIYNTRRAPGANTKRLQVGYAGETISLHQDSMEGTVPMEIQEEAQVVPGIELSTVAVNHVQDSMGLGIEVERAALATTSGNYGSNVQALTGSDKWSDPTADVLTQILDGKEAIRKRTGREPNKLVISSNQLNKLRVNDQIKAQFKYVTADSITTEMLARYFQLEKVIVPKAVYLDEADDDDADFKDAWGDFAALVYAPSVATGIQVPSFGYTYRLNGYPMVEQGYYERNIKSWCYPVAVEERPYQTAADAGFLFTGVTE